jgi:hypothetical protein
MPVALAAAILAIQPASAPDPWAKLHRPIHLPRVAKGATCPVTLVGRTGYPRGQGNGPVYPVGGFPELDYMWPVQPEQVFYPSRYGGNKVLWATRSHRGPVLIRGRQLDGPNDIRFGLARAPVRELRWTVTGAGWRTRPSTIRVRAPGCYAWQIDGKGFSDVVVFRANALLIR